MGADSTIATMRKFSPPPSASSLERIAATSSEEVALQLRALHVPSPVVAEVKSYWDEFRVDIEWVQLLARLLTMVTRDRGSVDAPIPIWDDLDDAGASGRLLYLYLFALCADDTRAFLRDGGCPASVIERTMSILARHVAVHERVSGTVGVDPGWWTLLVLRGELLQIGSLQFHRVNLGVGTLSPFPWYDDDQSAALGAGFRRGDPSVGIHIPDRTPLGPGDLDATIDEAREVLSALWPVSQRRLATCQSWLLDPQLEDYLGPTSNILAFQRRFTLLPTWVEGDDDTLTFVFRRPGATLDQLPRSTTVERAVLDLLERGGHWHLQPGWFDFDGR